MSPEAAAREKIDALLVAVGWAIQGCRAFNPSAARGIALREVPLDSGRRDFLLLVDHVPLGVIEAKKEGTTLSTVAQQSSHDGENLPDFFAAHLPGTKKIPFAYESTSVETLSRDERDPEPRSRRGFAFHQPATPADLLAETDTLRARLPRTLFFAKDDSHAEDLVHLVREVFGRGNDFAKKITYKSYNPETNRYEKSESLIAVPRPRLRPTSIRRRRTRSVGAAETFRTSPTRRIAVTDDMIATDINPLEVLLFMRGVGSRTFFEQMNGRGVSVVSDVENRLQSLLYAA